ncbi:probable CDPK-related protein kinase [Coccomyxa sp. Obi]|nr:probable CDPK-related protein kinase [Coccomyxa sp. Obi]
MDAQIGVGSFGKVYRMTSKRDPRSRFAVKIVPKHHKNLPDDVVISRIHDEVDILRTLQSCPETVRLVDVIEDGQQVYIVMELCEGGDLLQFLKEHGPMTEWEASQAALSILHLLCECHRQGILYADLKPNNILLKPLYRRSQSPQQHLQLRIADFGCSQRLQACSLACSKGHFGTL